ncbi:hypothetical protein DXG03_003367 [Asterophora parasitica]|uniref:histone deacetylase n=1 Tax=Asterophora parasitica TaxID=117018 RepID=A0A9P7G181_9AGAR|nr:hypothetical protein DXG03_003367 [Asterophora parasitica]
MRPDGVAPNDRQVAYIVSPELIAASSQLPSNKGRSTAVHTLIHAYGLSKHVKVVRPVKASYKELAAYHTREYLDAVLDSKRGASPGLRGGDNGEEEEFGLDSDCPPFPALAAYVPLVAGASLTAARALMDSVSPVHIAICWDGGRHHAQKGAAKGFCYVADCVLAVLALKRGPNTRKQGTGKTRVMYLDLDLHFSDAVSQAFAGSMAKAPQILTLSIHYAAPGFYPPSPLASLPDPTSTNFDPSTLSIPLHAGAGPATLLRIWDTVENVKRTFDPDYVVLQCGVDALSGDPCAIGNWDLESLGEVVGRVVRGWDVPVLLLGGGGYNTPNTARAWAYLTSVALDDPLALDAPIPDHANFPAYGPSFTLDVPKGMMQDQNSEAYLCEVEACYEAVVEVLKDRMGSGPATDARTTVDTADTDR